MQQGAAGQTAEDHGRHHLIHVHVCRTPLTAAEEREGHSQNRADINKTKNNTDRDGDTSPSGDVDAGRDGSDDGLRH